MRWSLVVMAVAGLGVDAYTHFDLASVYDLNATSTVSQGTLFRIEGALAIAVGVALLVRANLWTVLAVLLVAGGGLALLLVYRYVNVGKLGPLPNMSEPIWYREKEVSAIGEGVAVLAGAGVLATLRE